MYKILVSTFVVVSTFVGSIDAEAGCLFRRNCARVAAVRVAAVQNVVDVQFTPTFVSFVPSQVLLNSQVTTYGVQSAGVGYSYQGGYQSAQTAQAAQAQSAPATGVEARLERLEKLLLKLAGEDVGVAAASTGGAWRNLLDKSCRGCHSPGGKGYKDLALYDSNGLLRDKLPKYKIYESISEGRMPKGGPAISDPDTLDALRTWVHVGLKDLEY
jgi:mono/diheme cytochrome c family protein